MVRCFFEDSEVSVGHENPSHGVNKPLAVGEAPGDVALGGRDDPVRHGLRSHQFILLLGDGDWARVVPEAHEHGDLHLLHQSVVEQRRLGVFLLKPVRIVDAEAVRQGSLGIEGDSLHGVVG